jgi:hypothetical protein
MVPTEFVTDDWPARLCAGAEESRRRAAARAAERRARAVRRANGLVDRHAGRLADARRRAARAALSRPDSPGG